MMFLSVLSSFRSGTRDRPVRDLDKLGNTAVFDGVFKPGIIPTKKFDDEAGLVAKNRTLRKNGQYCVGRSLTNIFRSLGFRRTYLDLAIGQYSNIRYTEVKVAKAGIRESSYFLYLRIN